MTLGEWLRWLADMPPEFRGAPQGFSQGTVRVRAVVADLFETLWAEPPGSALLRAFEPARLNAVERERLAWVLWACHVCWHPELRDSRPDRAAVIRLFVEELAGLAAVAKSAALDRDEERREELVRRVLRAFKRRLEGESAAEAEDRLRQVDSVERHRLFAAAAQRERRAREIREAMERKAAEEAAAKVSRE